MTPLSKSPFSLHFKILTFWGIWFIETNSYVIMTTFVLYKLTVILFGLFGAISMMVDFYLVMGDLKKMSWNLCVSIFFIGLLIKVFNIMPKYEIINSLRLSLHRYAESRGAAEDAFIHKKAVEQLKVLQIAFYSTAIICIPVWLATRYIGHRGEPPIPIRLLFIDLKDDRQFEIFFPLISLIATIGIIISIETELSMFSLMIQISREYIVLKKDLLKLSELYEIDGVNRKREINPFLKKLKTKLLVKELSARHGELIHFIEIFELCYSRTFVTEFFGLGILIVVLGLQFMLEDVEISGNTFFQMGYFGILTIDMFLICFYSSKLNSQCHEIGDAAYSTLWYNMSTECQKDIAMMIMRAQHPPKITTGKLMVLDLNAFMNAFNNIISWLALFRGLLIHTESTKT